MGGGLNAVRGGCLRFSGEPTIDALALPSADVGDPSKRTKGVPDPLCKVESLLGDTLGWTD